MIFKVVSFVLILIAIVRSWGYFQSKKTPIVKKSELGKFVWFAGDSGNGLCSIAIEMAQPNAFEIDFGQREYQDIIPIDRTDIVLNAIKSAGYETIVVLNADYLFNLEGRFLKQVLKSATDSGKKILIVTKSYNDGYAYLFDNCFLGATTEQLEPYSYERQSLNLGEVLTCNGQPRKFVI